MTTSGNGPGPDGRKSVVRIVTPGCAAGTSQTCRRNAPSAGDCGPASGSLRGTKGTLKKKTTNAQAATALRKLKIKGRIRAIPQAPQGILTTYRELIHTDGANQQPS